MNILALDLATKTGWATLRSGQVESGVQDFSLQRGESRGMLFLKFSRWLDGMLGSPVEADFDSGPEIVVTRMTYAELVVYEQAHHRGGGATEIAVGLTTRVQEACARWGIECAPVHSGTLKKFATGKGNAGKPEVLAAMSEFWKRPLVDDNEADALALLKYAMERLVPEVAA